MKDRVRMQKNSGCATGMESVSTGLQSKMKIIKTRASREKKCNAMRKLL